MNRYQIFLKVLALGSFTKAAEELGYTQSAVSQMIHSLESEMGTTLLLRSRSGVELTADGSELLPYIHNICNSYHSLSEKLKEMHGLKSGVIRIGTFSSVSCHWLPGLINEFQRAHPDISFQIYQGMEYSDMQHWIKDGQVDFSFSSQHVLDGQHIALCEDRMLAILSPDHPLADRSVIPLSELVKEPYILLEEGSLSELTETFQNLHLSPNIRYRVHDDYTIMSMVELNMGVSIISEIFLNRMPYRLTAREVDPPITRTLSLVFRRFETLPVAARHFIDLIVRTYGQSPEGLSAWNAMSR